MEYAITDGKRTVWMGGYEDFDRALCEHAGARELYVFSRFDADEDWAYQFTVKWDAKVSNFETLYAPK